MPVAVSSAVNADDTGSPNVGNKGLIYLTGAVVNIHISRGPPLQVFIRITLPVYLNCCFQQCKLVQQKMYTSLLSKGPVSCLNSQHSIG